MYFPNFPQRGTIEKNVWFLLIWTGLANLRCEVLHDSMNMLRLSSGGSLMCSGTRRRRQCSCWTASPWPSCSFSCASQAFRRTGTRCTPSTARHRASSSAASGTSCCLPASSSTSSTSTGSSRSSRAPARSCAQRGRRTMARPSRQRKRGEFVDIPFRIYTRPCRPCSLAYNTGTWGNLLSIATRSWVEWDSHWDLGTVFYLTTAFSSRCQTVVCVGLFSRYHCFIYPCM